jgi:hypothetical protein
VNHHFECFADYLPKEKKQLKPGGTTRKSWLKRKQGTISTTTLSGKRNAVAIRSRHRDEGATAPRLPL